MNNTKPKTKKSKKLPILPICFFGHRRRKLAVLCIQRLKEHLKFTGYEPKFIFGNCGKDEEYRSMVIQAIKDNEGETIKSKQEQIWEVIDKMNITRDQKDALHLIFL